MIKSYVVAHPTIPDVVEEVVVENFWQENGRNRGLVLRFADKPRALTYDEIAKLAEAARQMQEVVA